MDPDALLSPDVEVISLYSKDTEDTDMTEDSDSDEQSTTHSSSHLKPTNQRAGKAFKMAVNVHELRRLARFYRWRRCMESRPCVVCVYLCVTLVLLTSLVCLGVVVLLLLVPYIKVSHYDRTVCSPNATHYTVQELQCNCGNGCTSLFPCLLISVRLQDLNYSQYSQGYSVLYENEATSGKQCSFYPDCQNSQVANADTVRAYEHRYGRQGVSYPCYYSPRQPDHVIREKSIRLDAVLHGLVWTIIAVVMSAGIAYALVRRHRNATV